MPRKKPQTRRPRYAGSVIVRKDQRIEVRYWLKTAFDTYEPHSVTLPAGTPKAAGQVMLEQINAARDSNTLRTHTRESVGAWLDRWLVDIIAPDQKPKTVDNYRWAISHIAAHIGHLELRSLTPQHVRALATALRRHIRPNGKPLAPTSIAQIMRTLKASLNDARREGLLRENVATLVQIGTPEPAERVPLTPAEAARVLRTLAKHPQLLAIELAVMRGMRSGELRSLRWSDIDYEARTLTVASTLYQPNVKAARAVKPKSKKGRRTVPLSDALIAALHARRAQQLSDRLRAGDRWHGHDELVITTVDGKPVWGSTILKLFNSACRKAGVPVVTVHDLRHTANTIMANEGIDAVTRMAILGQASDTINRVYTHTSPERVADAVDALERSIREAEGT